MFGYAVVLTLMPLEGLVELPGVLRVSHKMFLSANVRCPSFDCLRKSSKSTACTTCACPGHSRWRRARPCPACGRASMLFPSCRSPFFWEGPSPSPAERNSRTHPNAFGSVREQNASVRMNLQINSLLQERMRVN